MKNTENTENTENTINEKLSALQIALENLQEKINTKQKEQTEKTIDEKISSMQKIIESQEKQLEEFNKFAKPKENTDNTNETYVSLSDLGKELGKTTRA